MMKAKSPEAYSPEERLLLLCMRAALGEEPISPGDDFIPERVDWNYLLELAWRHALAPILHTGLRQARGRAIPPDFMAKLSDTVRKNTQRNLLLNAELLEILAQLESLGIEALPLKGPVLSHYLFGSIAMRQFADLDVLVRPRAVCDAVELLMSRGYRPRVLLNRKQMASLVQFGWQYRLFHPERAYSVQLHWRIAPVYFSVSFPLRAMWRRVTSVSLAGTTVRMPCPVDLLFMLCIHGTRHLWMRLVWVHDIALILPRIGDTGWREIMRLARSSGAERMVLVGLALARKLLGVRLPDELMREIEHSSEVQRLAALAESFIFSHTDIEPSIFESCLFHIRSRERPRDRVSYLIRFAVEPTVGDIACLTLPQPLRYLVRPLRVIAKRSLPLLKCAP